MAQRSVPHVWRPVSTTEPGLHRLSVDTGMIALAWLGVIASVCGIVWASLRGELMLAAAIAVFGCYCWAVLWALISEGDWEPWDDE